MGFLQVVLRHEARDVVQALRRILSRREEPKHCTAYVLCVSRGTGRDLAFRIPRLAKKRYPVSGDRETSAWRVPDSAHTQARRGVDTALHTHMRIEWY